MYKFNERKNIAKKIYTKRPRARAPEKKFVVKKECKKAGKMHAFGKNMTICWLKQQLQSTINFILNLYILQKKRSSEQLTGFSLSIFNVHSKNIDSIKLILYIFFYTE